MYRNIYMMVVLRESKDFYHLVIKILNSHKYFFQTILPCNPRLSSSVLIRPVSMLQENNPLACPKFLFRSPKREVQFHCLLRLKIARKHGFILVCIHVYYVRDVNKYLYIVRHTDNL